MKPFILRWLGRALNAGLRPSLLAAALLLGSACLVDVEETEPVHDDVAEADDMLHGPAPEAPQVPVERADGHAVDELDEFGEGERRGSSPIVLPGMTVAEPEPDPWDDPMSGSQSSSNGSGKD